MTVLLKCQTREDFHQGNLGYSLPHVASSPSIGQQFCSVRCSHKWIKLLQHNCNCDLNQPDEVDNFLWCWIVWPAPRRMHRRWREFCCRHREQWSTKQESKPDYRTLRGNWIIINISATTVSLAFCQRMYLLSALVLQKPLAYVRDLDKPSNVRDDKRDLRLHAPSVVAE